MWKFVCRNALIWIRVICSTIVEFPFLISTTENYQKWEKVGCTVCPGTWNHSNLAQTFDSNSRAEFNFPEYPHYARPELDNYTRAVKERQ